MKKEMIANAKGHNKYLTREFLESKTFNQLLSYVNPIDRHDFIKRFDRGEEF